MNFKNAFVSFYYWNIVLASSDIDSFISKSNFGIALITINYLLMYKHKRKIIKCHQSFSYIGIVQSVEFIKVYQDEVREAQCHDQCECNNSSV